MPVTWSISRDRMLHTCERRYYFQYLANARINSRDEMLREIAFLKKLKNIPMWKGDVFHSVVADYLRGVQKRRIRRSVSYEVTNAKPELLSGLRDRMTREYAFSANRIFRMDPRAIDKDGGLALFEHEYDEESESEGGDLTRAIRDVEKWVCQFAEWAEYVYLVNRVQRATRVWVEPPIYGRWAPGFNIDGVQVLVKVDLALLTKDRNFEIFDWKTGMPSSFLSRQIDLTEFQVNVYQLWPHLALEHPLDAIKANLVYVATAPVHQASFEIDENLREYTLSLVRRSIARVKHFSDSYGGEKLELKDFDFAASTFYCQRCSFKRLCQNALEL